MFSRPNLIRPRISPLSALRPHTPLVRVVHEPTIPMARSLTDDFGAKAARDIRARSSNKKRANRSSRALRSLLPAFQSSDRSGWKHYKYNSNAAKGFGGKVRNEKHERKVDPQVVKLTPERERQYRALLSDHVLFGLPAFGHSEIDCRHNLTIMKLKEYGKMPLAYTYLSMLNEHAQDTGFEDLDSNHVEAVLENLRKDSMRGGGVSLLRTPNNVRFSAELFQLDDALRKAFFDLFGSLSASPIDLASILNKNLEPSNTKTQALFESDRAVLTPMVKEGWEYDAMAAKIVMFPALRMVKRDREAAETADAAGARGRLLAYGLTHTDPRARIRSFGVSSQEELDDLISRLINEDS